MIRNSDPVDLEDGTIPLLAVVYGPLEHEQPIDDLADAARGVCRLLWVLPYDDRRARTALRLRRASGEVGGEVVDISACAPQEAADLVAAHRPDGITCFTDENIAVTAQLAASIGLTYHSPCTAEQLTDKLHQRSAFAAAGLPTPSFWDVDALNADPALVEEVGGEGFPLVLKPRRGFGSVDTESVHDAEELRAVVAAAAPGRMILEGYIPDPTVSPVGAGSAPYASVDLVAARGGLEVVGMTGRMPLAEPFRETGSFFPVDVPGPVGAELIDAAVAATRALGVEHGVLRVEIKWTDDGPVVIEVNGRPDGGSTRDFLRQALGIDTFRIAMRTALGQPVAFGAGTAPDTVHFRFDLVPDMRLRRISEVRGLDAVRALPGVDRVIPGIAAGDEFSWRDGSFALVATVLGTAPDHATAHLIRREVDRLVVVSGS